LSFFRAIAIMVALALARRLIEAIVTRASEKKNWTWSPAPDLWPGETLQRSAVARAQVANDWSTQTMGSLYLTELRLLWKPSAFRWSSAWVDAFDIRLTQVDGLRKDAPGGDWPAIRVSADGSEIFLSFGQAAYREAEDWLRALEAATGKRGSG